MLAEISLWQFLKDNFVIIRLLKHPHNDFYQCTTLFRLEMESNLTFVEGEPVFRFYGTDPKIIYAAYNFSFLLFVYFLPLACIVCGFLGIFAAVKRKLLIFEKVYCYNSLV